MRMSFLLLVASVLLASCGGGGAETESTTTQSDTGGETSESATLPTVSQPWAEMSQQERGAFMHDSVVPVTRQMFQEYDGERYADFGCGTCHGADMAEREFAMPNPGLLPLFPTGSDEQRAAVEGHPQMVRFMFNHLLPTVRDMLQLAEFDANTGEGFSCYSCHPHGAPAEPADAGGTVEPETPPEAG